MFKQLCLVFVALTVPAVWGDDEIRNFKENLQTYIDNMQKKINSTVTKNENAMQNLLDQIKDAGAPIAEQVQSQLNDNIQNQIKAINETASQMGGDVTNCLSTEWDIINKITNSTIDDVNKCVKEHSSKAEDIIKKSKENMNGYSVVDIMKQAAAECKNHNILCYGQIMSNSSSYVEEISNKLNTNLIVTISNATSVVGNYNDCVTVNLKNANEKLEKSYHKIQDCVNATTTK